MIDLPFHSQPFAILTFMVDHSQTKVWPTTNNKLWLGNRTACRTVQINNIESPNESQNETALTSKQLNDGDRKLVSRWQGEWET